MNYLKFLFMEQQIAELQNSQVDIILHEKIQKDLILILRPDGKSSSIPSFARSIYEERGSELFNLSELNKKLLLLTILKADQEMEKIIMNHRKKGESLDKGDVKILFGRIDPFKPESDNQPSLGSLEDLNDSNKSGRRIIGGGGGGVGGTSGGYNGGGSVGGSSIL